MLIMKMISKLKGYPIDLLYQGNECIVIKRYNNDKVKIVYKNFYTIYTKIVDPKEVEIL